MPDDPLRLGIIGAEGRLGSRVWSRARALGFAVTMAATRRSWSEPEALHVIVDASRGDVLPRSAELAQRYGAALVVCASDLTADAPTVLAALAEHVPVVRAVNLSVGHWLQCHLLAEVGKVVRRLPQPPAVAVLERHPTAKRDRPSASAVALADAWKRGTGEAVTDVSSYRSGLPVSEHRVDLTFGFETLSLHHDVRDLEAAAWGAATAAAWARCAPAGLVSITEVLDHVLLAKEVSP